MKINFLENTGLYVMPEERSDIDTELDYKFVAFLMKMMLNKRL